VIFVPATCWQHMFIMRGEGLDATLDTARRKGLAIHRPHKHRLGGAMETGNTAGSEGRGRAGMGWPEGIGCCVASLLDRRTGAGRMEPTDPGEPATGYFPLPPSTALALPPPVCLTMGVVISWQTPRKSHLHVEPHVTPNTHYSQCCMTEI